MHTGRPPTMGTATLLLTRRFGALTSRSTRGKNNMQPRREGRTISTKYDDLLVLS